MSEEELIKYIEENFEEVYKDCMKDCDGDEDIFVFQYVIKKLQKELEQEKEKNNILEQEKEYLNCIIESDKDNYINKDKIRALIKENAYSDTYNFKTIEVSKLEELLEE